MRKVIAVIVLSASAITAGAMHSGSHSTPTHSKTHIVACKTEDSTNCLWDAKREGNHKGRSFIDYKGKLYQEVR
jgi:hypothetical protein